MADTPTTLAALLVDAQGAGALCGMSESHWHRLAAADRVPRPVKLGRRFVRWRTDDLAAWVRLGCPDRSTFESLTNARGRT